MSSLTRRSEPGAGTRRTRRRRYPWRTWTAPGAGPFHVLDTDVPKRHLSGVLRTWAARKGRQVRLMHVPDGLLFQFGPPFGTILDPAETVDVLPGAVACPTCGRPLPEPEPEPVPEPERAIRRSRNGFGAGAADVPEPDDEVLMTLHVPQEADR